MSGGNGKLHPRRIGDIADVVRGVTYSSGEASDRPIPGTVPLLRAGNIGSTLDTEHDLVWVPRSRVSESQLLRLHDIVICTSSGSASVVGKTAPVTSKFDGTFGAFLGVVRPNTKVHPGFLRHWFRSEEFLRWRDRQNLGINIKNLRLSEVADIEVHLPSSDEQKRIAGILDKADGVRRKRREAIKLADDLLRATFLEMFGDPVTNPKGWDVKSLAELCTIRGQYGLGSSAVPYDDALPRYVRITDIDDEGELNDNAVSASGEPADWEDCWLEEGDLLFARSGATVGKTYLHRNRNGKCVFAGYLIRFRADRRLALPEYFFAFTKTAAYSAWVSARQRVVAQPNINARQYGHDLLLPVPPIELQKEFAANVSHFEGTKRHLRDATAEADALFNSLMQRAFTGRL